MPDSFRALPGQPSASDVERWQRAFAQADALEQSGQLAEACAVLAAVVAEMRTATGTAVDRYLGALLGRLASLHFDLGRYPESHGFAQAALEECLRIGDQAGVTTYRENLRLTSRVLQQRSTDPNSHLEAEVAEAQLLSDQADYEASNLLLDRVLQHPSWKEGGILAGKLYGLMGLNHYRLRDWKQAHDATTRALLACEQAGDGVGAWVYRTNLAVVLRTREQNECATARSDGAYENEPSD